MQFQSSHGKVNRQLSFDSEILQKHELTPFNRNITSNDKNTLSNFQTKGILFSETHKKQFEKPKLLPKDQLSQVGNKQVQNNYTPPINNNLSSSFKKSHPKDLYKLQQEKTDTKQESKYEFDEMPYQPNKLESKINLNNSFQNQKKDIQNNNNNNSFQNTNFYGNDNNENTQESINLIDQSMQNIKYMKQNYEQDYQYSQYNKSLSQQENQASQSFQNVFKDKTNKYKYANLQKIPQDSQENKPPSILNLNTPNLKQKNQNQEKITSKNQFQKMFNKSQQPLISEKDDQVKINIKNDIMEGEEDGEISEIDIEYVQDRYDRKQDNSFYNNSKEQDQIYKQKVQEQNKFLSQSNFEQPYQKNINKIHNQQKQKQQQQDFSNFRFNSNQNNDPYSNFISNFEKNYKKNKKNKTKKQQQKEIKQQDYMHNFYSKNCNLNINKFTNNKNSQESQIAHDFPELTLNQCVKIFKFWEEREFRDFNIWVQKSKAKIDEHYTRPQNQLESGLSQHYLCTLTLSLPRFQNVENIVVTGICKGKKDSRRATFPKLIHEILVRGYLKYGFSSRRYIDQVLNIDKAINKNESKDIQNNSMEEEDEENSNFKLEQYYAQQNKQNQQEDQSFLRNKSSKQQNMLQKRLREKINTCLQQNQFGQACEKLATIIQMKDAQFADYQGMLKYCLDNQDLAKIQCTIDVIQNRAFNKEIQQNLQSPIFNRQIKKFLESDEKDGVTQQLFVSNKNNKKLKTMCQILQENYGFQRTNSENPFEIEDFTKIYNNETDNCQHQIKKKSDIDEIFVTDIARKYIDLLRQIESVQNLKPIDQNNFKYNLKQYQILPFGYIETEVLNEPDLKIFLKNQYLAKLQNSPKDDIDLMPKDKNQLQDCFQCYFTSFNINRIFESLLFIEDHLFALRCSELLYSRINPSTKEFQQVHSGNYFMNKRIQITQQFIEKIHKSIRSPSTMGIEQYTCLQGVCQVTSVNNIQLALDFNTSESPEIVESKTYKHSSFSPFNQEKFMQNDMCILLTFFEPSEMNPNLNESQLSPLALYLNNISKVKNHADQIPILKTMTEYGRKVEVAMLAQIKSMNKEGMLMKLVVQSTEKQNNFFKRKYRQWKLVKLTNLEPYYSQVQAIQDLCTDNKMSHLIQKILLAPPQTKKIYTQNLAETIIEKELLDSKLSLQLNNFINQNQYLAIIQSIRQLVTLIQAPLSTGRTKVLLKILEQLFKINGQKILILVKNELQMNQIYTYLKKFEMQILKLNQSELQKYSQVKGKVQNQRICIIDKDSIPYFNFNQTAFQKVIIFEAQELNEIECLSVINKTCNQLILIGDQMLPQNNSNNISYIANSRGYNRSLFEILLEKGLKPVFLDSQTKDNEQIGKYISKNFYNNKLNIMMSKLPNKVNLFDKIDPQGFSPFEQKIQSSNESFQNLKFQKNMLFNNQGLVGVQTNGCEIKYENGLINISEIKSIVQFVLFLLGHDIVSVQDIGIITSYNQQKQLMQNEFKIQAQNNPQIFDITHQNDTKDLKLQINSIFEDYDSKPFILFSPVRANKHGDLGILQDYKIQNLLLSKSQKCFVLFGDLPTIVHENSWNNYVNQCKKQQTLFQYDIFQ